MTTVLTAAAALALHLVLGWAWTPVAAFGGGWARPQGAGLRGALALLLSWGALIAWTYALDADGASRAAGLLAGVLGGLPGVVAVALSLLIALLLGALGGMAGAAARHLRPAPAAADPA